MPLKSSQLRALRFALEGELIGPNPGWNVDIEYDFSEGGVELMLDGDDLADLVKRGLMEAVPLPESEETDEGVTCSHLYVVTIDGVASMAAN